MCEHSYLDQPSGSVGAYLSSSTGELESFEQDQKDHFRQLVRNRIAEREVQFVGEEMKDGELSIVHEVCASEKCPYANIEMHPDERAKRGIPNNYESDPKTHLEKPKSS
jgi:hypothetical protein